MYPTMLINELSCGLLCIQGYQWDVLVCYWVILMCVDASQSTS